MANALSLTQSGSGGFFNNIGPVFSPGFKVIFRPVRSNKQPTTPPAFTDPRGLFPSGLLPASTFAYEFSEQLREPVIISGTTANSLGISLVGSASLTMSSMVSIIVFEGHDVIDLDTSTLPKGSNGGFLVPDYVFAPIFLGDPVSATNENFSDVAALEYIAKSKGNGLGIGVGPSDHPPLDTLTAVGGVLPQQAVNFPLIDTASKEILGSGKFLSYVAIDRPVFRDVLYMRTGVQADGTFDAIGFKISNVAPLGAPSTRIYRYAFINVADKNSPPKFQWRLSETFGFQPAKTQLTPNGLITKANVGSVAGEATLSQHFVYNLSDLSGAEITNRNPPSVIKTGYAPALAKAKMDKKSSYFDPNFSAQIIPTKSNDLFFQSRLQTNSLTALPLSTDASGLNDTITLVRNYTSPTFSTPLGKNGRLGLEYALHNFSHTNVYAADPITILVSIGPASPGLAAFRDPCTKSIVLYDVNTTPVERVFYDSKWIESSVKLPTGDLRAFLLGESPYRTDGAAILYPQFVDLNISGTSGNISIPSGQNLAGVFISTKGADPKNPPVLQLIDSGPVFEAASDLSVDQQFIGLPPISPKSFVMKNGGSVTKFVTVPSKFLAPPVAPATASDQSKSQITAIKDETFPIRADSITATSISAYGQSIIAYAQNERIDIGYRSTPKDPYIPVRDVTLRIADSGSPNGTFPSAGFPVLLPAASNGTIFLFYVYKNRILLKRIPNSIFTTESSATKNGAYASDAEGKLISTIQSITSVVAYDGDLKDKNKNITTDLAAQSITVPSETLMNPRDQQANIEEYSGCFNHHGKMYLFIQDSDRIRVRASSNLGLSWNNVLPDNFYFLPQNDKTHLATSGQEAEAPYCYYSDSRNAIMLFFIFGKALLFMEIPDDYLLASFSSNLIDSLSKINPTVIYGDLNSDLELRGIQLSVDVQNRKRDLKDKFTESISPHRVAVEQTESGHLRLFFKDDVTSKIRSLISTTSGKSWQTEDQFLKSRS